eukprot:Skav230297  [mRNA]  locus=scaffold2934:152500:170188:- [translate_table: standard]
MVLTLLHLFSLAAASPPYAKLPGITAPTDTFELHDGKQMPVMGLGVFMMKPGDETYNAVKWALEAGYRMIDTATIYQNEESVGKAMAELWDSDHGYEAAIEGLETSLKKLKPEFLERSEVTDVVKAHSATSAQVLLRWALQMGFQIIPKSVKKHRIEENLKVFDLELTAKEMDGLSSMEGNLNQYWQPLGAPVDVTCQQKAGCDMGAACSKQPQNVTNGCSQRCQIQLATSRSSLASCRQKRIAAEQRRKELQLELMGIASSLQAPEGLKPVPPLFQPSGASLETDHGVAPQASDAKIFGREDFNVDTLLFGLFGMFTRGKSKPKGLLEKFPVRRSELDEEFDVLLGSGLPNLLAALKAEGIIRKCPDLKEDPDRAARLRAYRDRRPTDPFFYPTTVSPLTGLGLNLIEESTPPRPQATCSAQAEQFRGLGGRAGGAHSQRPVEKKRESEKRKTEKTERIKEKTQTERERQKKTQPAAVEFSKLATLPRRRHGDYSTGAPLGRWLVGVPPGAPRGAVLLEQAEGVERRVWLEERVGLQVEELYLLLRLPTEPQQTWGVRALSVPLPPAPPPVVDLTGPDVIDVESEAEEAD